MNYSKTLINQAKCAPDITRITKILDNVDLAEFSNEINRHIYINDGDLILFQVVFNQCNK